MPQLGHFQRTVQDTSGNALSGVSVTLYREGATVSGDQSGTSPLTVTVRDNGKIEAADTVFVNTTTGTTYTVDSTTDTTVVLSGFAGTLSLTNGDRIVPSNSQPTLYGDDQGGATKTNPLTTSATGYADCYMEAGAYEVLISGGTATTTLFQAQVVGSETLAQVRYAEGYPGANGGAKITNAIADLPAGGGVVDARGLTGSQSISSTLVLNVPCVLLIGQTTLTGSVDPLIQVTSADVSIIGIHPNLSILQNTTTAANVIKVNDGVDRFVLDQVKIDGGGQTLGAADIGVGVLISTEAEQSSGLVSTDNVISNCIFQDVQDAVRGYNVDRSQFVNNKILFTHRADLAFYLKSSDNNVISGNVMNSTDATGSVGFVFLDHVSNAASKYNTVSGNTIYGNYSHELVNIFGQFNSVTGNVLNIASTASTGSSVALNAPNYNDSSSPCVFNTVTGNVVRMTGTLGNAAITLVDSGDSFGANDNVVSGNAISTHTVGISVGNFCSRNVVWGNRISVIAGGPASQDGIIVNGTSNVDTVVVGNLVDGATRHGIHINTALRAVVNSNHCSGCTTDGVRLANSTNSTLVGNILRNNTGAGALITATAQRDTVDGLNSAPGNTTSGIDRSAQTITAVGDTITPYGSVHLINANASYTLTSAPTIADGFDDQEITILNVDSSDVITIQDQGSLASSNLRLGAASRAIGPRDSIRLRYSSDVGDWIELWFSNVV